MSRIQSGKTALARSGAEALSYLNMKYGRTFELVSASGQGWGQPCDIWHARQSGGGNPVFTVTGTDTPDGRRFGDAFYSVLILPEYEAFVKSIISAEYERFTLRTDISRDSVNPAGLTADVPLADIHKHLDGHGISAKITIAVPSLDGADGHMRAICGRIAEARLMAWVVCHAGDNRRLAYCIDKDYKVSAQDNGALPVFAAAADVLDTRQLERLCSIVYLNGIVNGHTENLGGLMRYMLALGLENEMVCGVLPAEMTEAEWRNVIRAIIDDPALSTLKIAKYIDVTEPRDDVLPGHRAVCFMDGMSNAYVVFRGTCGDDEWQDNADGMFQSDTIQQQASARFIEEVRAMPGVRRLIAAGHSKGGNKAQYVTITTGLVDRCLSLDGQGFSQAFLDKYKAAVSIRGGLIEHAAERRDFVNCLGLPVGQSVYYSGRRGEHSAEYPHGQPLPFFHCPDALRTTDGAIGPEAKGYISVMLNMLVTYLLTNPAYKDKRQSTAEDLMSLMMKSRRASDDEIAGAIVNLLLVFFDLTAHSKAFCDSIEDVLLQETDVLLATLEMLTRTKQKDSLGRLSAKKLARELILKPWNMLNFSETLSKLRALVKKSAKESDLPARMERFMSDVQSITDTR